MEPDGAVGARGAPPGPGAPPVDPSLRQYLPSPAFGAVLPLCAYFVARRHVSNDTALCTRQVRAPRSLERCR